MNIPALVTLAGVIAVAAAPTRAEDSAKGQAKVRKITFAYATCVVRKHHDKASEAILATADNDTIISKFAQIIDADCLGAAAGSGVDMRFPADSYRFALADALVNADFASRGDVSFADRLPLAQPLLVSRDEAAQRLAKAKGDRNRKEVQEGIDKGNALALLARYGECVVRRDPVKTRYWLLTQPNAPEEDSRIKVLLPAFADCLGEGTVKINRITMRGTVAVNYYRLAMATVVPGAGSAH